ncbi:MAG: hypothetical protein J4F50_11160 [Acidimicrobiia bacterium]|nr:hypothetical protein [Acidimicrobiia bacterium]
MSRLTALVPAEVCAAALGRRWPDDLDGRVRCIDEGTRTLGLAYCCAPWSVQAEDYALRAETGARISLEGGRGSFGPLDDVAAGLARTPAAPPVVGVVSGPLGWSVRHAASPGRAAGVAVAGALDAASDLAAADALDAASDLAAARIHELASCGAERVAVVEQIDGGRWLDATLAAEMHRPILRAADHLRVDLVLVAIGQGAGAVPPGTLGYSSWVSPDGCSGGLAFLPSAAAESSEALDRCLDRLGTDSEPGEVITGPLDDSVSPDLLRRASRLLSGEVARP